jgi:GTPase
MPDTALRSTPVIALVGRPNVGKSTLFNRLTRSRAALVADVPGLTRDRHYGRASANGRNYIVIDTGGFEPVAKEGLAAAMAQQARQAVLEADVVCFICDARAGLTGHDQQIAQELRRTSAKLKLVINKAEGMPSHRVSAEFFELGLGDPLPISAAHGEGVRELVDLLLEQADLLLAQNAPAVAANDQPASAAPIALEQQADAEQAIEGGGEPGVAPAEAAVSRALRVAVVGRPNVGKSTLINALLGEDRLIAFDMPGTTRDSVAVDFERRGKPYILVDTAGVRRRGKVTDMIEKFSVVKTLQAIEDCNVCILMLDAQQDVAEQDAHIADYILESGRAVVLAVNKWDGLQSDQRDAIKRDLERKLHFLRFADLHFISALRGQGIDNLMRSVDAAYASAITKLPTPKLTRALIEAVERQAPPRKGPVRPKLRYAHQGGQNPPVVVVHGNALDNINDTYKRYLETWFREQFRLTGTPLRIEFRSSHNPYADKK